MSKVTVPRFLELLLKSKLMEENAIREFQDELGSSETPVADLDSADALANRLIERGTITPWQASKLLDGRYKGFFLGKYRLLGHLGTGGMSAVYLAEQTAMRRRVAIKVLPRNKVNDPSFVERFRQEALAAAALSHPNIVHAYDVDNDGDIHYLVMELVDGQDLSRHVKQRGPLPFLEAAEYIRQAADGLQHAHRVGVVHRDIKPANLLIDHNQVVKILDMGLAKFEAGETKESLTLAFNENVLGTADYLAPEQAINSHLVDHRADIYSLGCSLYYAITGSPPFPEGTLTQRLIKHQTEKPKSITAYRPECPAELVRICGRMMSKSPAMRYQTAAEVSAELATWIQRYRILQARAPASGISQVANATAAALQEASAKAGAQQVGGNSRPGSPGFAIPGEYEIVVGESISTCGSNSGPSPISNALIDTSENLARITVKGSNRAKGDAQSGSQPNSPIRQTRIPVAKALPSKALPSKAPTLPRAPIPIPVDSKLSLKGEFSPPQRPEAGNSPLANRMPTPPASQLANAEVSTSSGMAAQVRQNRSGTFLKVAVTIGIVTALVAGLAIAVKIFGG